MRELKLEWQFDSAGIPTKPVPPAGFTQSDCDAATTRLAAMYQALKALRPKLPKAVKPKDAK